MGAAGCLSSPSTLGTVAPGAGRGEEGEGREQWDGKHTPCLQGGKPPSSGPSPVPREAQPLGLGWVGRQELERGCRGLVPEWVNVVLIYQARPSLCLGREICHRSLEG